MTTFLPGLTPQPPRGSHRGPGGPHGPHGPHGGPGIGHRMPPPPHHGPHGPHGMFGHHHHRQLGYGGGRGFNPLDPLGVNRRVMGAAGTAVSGVAKGAGNIIKGVGQVAAAPFKALGKLFG